MRCWRLDATGNRFVIVAPEDSPRDWSVVARRLCQGDLGTAADGLIVVEQLTTRGDFSARVINADGSEGGVSGNGARCVARYLSEAGLLADGVDHITLRMQAGDVAVEFQRSPDGRITGASVDMGPPREGDVTEFVGEDSLRWVDRSHGRLEVDGIQGWFVSMGNPHLIIESDEAILDDLFENLALEIGERLGVHVAFPEGVNVHWVRVVDDGSIELRSFERGVGLTLSCGSGASAACVALARDGRTHRAIDVRSPGGDLRLRWRESDSHVLLSGPVTLIESREIDV